MKNYIFRTLVFCFLLFFGNAVKASNFTVSSIHVYQYWDGFSGLLWAHYNSSSSSYTNSNLWPDDWMQFDFDINTTDPVWVRVYVDFDNDGSLSAMEELFLITDEPVAGSTPIYLNPSRGKQITPASGVASETFYTPFFTSASSRNSSTSNWLEPPHATVDTTLFIKVISDDETQVFTHDVIFYEYP